MVAVVYFIFKDWVPMFGIFKKKSVKQKLQLQYEKLLKEAHSLSTSNRKMSDQKMYEAERVMQEMEKLP